MSPHLEREDNNAKWVVIEGTSHSQCSPKKKLSSEVEKIHGILADTEGVIEVSDSLGDICFRPPKKRRFFKQYEPEPHGGINLINW